MTRKRAISELKQIYGMLAPDTQIALDIAINSLEIDEQYDLMYEQGKSEVQIMRYPQVDGITPTVVATDREGSIDTICKTLEQEPKTGHWIASRCDMYNCSECGHIYTDLSCGDDMAKFCPNCGVRMESDNNG